MYTPVPQNQPQQSRSDTAPTTTRPNTPAGYRSPEFHRLGSLDRVQLGYKGNNYDGASRYWYNE